ncbi:uncharacterized protein ACBT57_015965 isoform 2-T2 [Dama dama]|uniref:uncharacterized protein LOC133062526 isoform X2 n=1 Tax=Dama dama TaxID=30532 RepID=UPI002A35A617|nr:uncharacterized protein LOC133062526 isoform X2 [Dama dama]
MNSITTFAILALAAMTWAATPSVTSGDRQIGIEVNCTKYNIKSAGIACTKEWAPICGMDLKTYETKDLNSGNFIIMNVGRLSAPHIQKYAPWSTCLTVDLMGQYMATDVHFAMLS